MVNISLYAPSGAVANEGQFPAPTGSDIELLSTGPMCRYVEDLLPMLRVLVGPDKNLLKLDTQVCYRMLF